MVAPMGRKVFALSRSGITSAIPGICDKNTEQGNVEHQCSQSWPGPEPTTFSSLRCCSHPPVPSGSTWMAFLGSVEAGTVNAEAMIRLQESWERSRSDFLIQLLVDRPT